MSRLLVGMGLVMLGAVGVGAELPQAPTPRRIPVEELARGNRFAKQGQIDLFIASTAAWNLKAEDDRLWEPAQELGRVLIEKAELKGDRKPHECPSWYPDFAAFKKRCNPRLTRLDELYIRLDPDKAKPPVLYYNEAIQALGVLSPKGMINNLIVSRGNVSTRRTIQSSVIFANGNVTADGVIGSSIIICDGDVTVFDREIHQTLVIARGNITAKRGPEAVTLIAGGKVTVGKEPKLDEYHFNVIKENEPNPLGFVTFFELHRIGLEVKVADGAVQVSKVTAGKAAEKAGLKADDVILEVGGKKPTDAESLRQLLRDALALGDASVKLKRGNDTLSVKVILPE